MIPLYINTKKQPKGTIEGSKKVAKEVFNKNVYSDKIAGKIKNDLKNNPLDDNEKLVLIGYSGWSIPNFLNLKN